jgi:hypothetical protein
MASEAQRKREVLASLRRAKVLERSLDSALEKVEREIIRLRSRRTLIRADEVLKLATLWDSGFRPLVASTQQALADFATVVGS